jgi:hypothetical protein
MVGGTESESREPVVLQMNCQGKIYNFELYGQRFEN